MPSFKTIGVIAIVSLVVMIVWNKFAPASIKSMVS